MAWIVAEGGETVNRPPREVRERYSGANVPSNPLVLWLPSQKGFRLDPPQRHKLYGFPVGIVSGFPS